MMLNTIISHVYHNFKFLKDTFFQYIRRNWNCFQIDLPWLFFFNPGTVETAKSFLPWFHWQSSRDLQRCQSGPLLAVNWRSNCAVSLPRRSFLLGMCESCWKCLESFRQPQLTQFHPLCYQLLLLISASTGVYSLFHTAQNSFLMWKQ